MIDLHCHILPGIDDGAASLDISLEMARIAVAEGITTTACTPHIYPNVYENTGEAIRRDVQCLSRQLDEAGIPLALSTGAEIHIVHGLVPGLRSGRMLTLNDSRYVLLEPSYRAIPFGFAQIIFEMLTTGYVPIIAHPERLTWVDEQHYPWLVDAVAEGAWVQVTAGSLSGRFGQRARMLAENLLSDGLVHLIATDAHDAGFRRPLLGEGRRSAERYVGSDEAARLVIDRPRAVLENADPNDITPPPALLDGAERDAGAGISRAFKRLLHFRPSR
jgi:protein-tyrosine phosphatase